MELKVLFIFTCVTVAQCKCERKFLPNSNNTTIANRRIVHILVSLSCTQIRAFVDGHNSRRLLVANGKVPGQPAASEMKMMVWDEELAAKAAEWAKKNLHQHNPDRSVGSNRFRTGENLYWYSTTDLEYVLQPDLALDAWFQENEDYIFGPLQTSKYQIGDTGHYTQMVWSESVYLGCAVLRTFENVFNKFFVVCNYGPGGNYLGQKPYKEGNGRSNQLVRDIKNKCDRPYGPKC